MLECCCCAPEVAEVAALPLGESWGSSPYSRPSGGGQQSKPRRAGAEEMQPHQRSRTPRATVNNSALIGQVDPTAVVMSPQAAALIDSDRKQGTIDPPKRSRLIIDHDVDLLIVAPTPATQMDEFSPLSIGSIDVSHTDAKEVETYSPPTGPASPLPAPKEMGAQGNQPIDDDLERFLGSL
jgi:hypothetical protein